MINSKLKQIFDIGFQELIKLSLTISSNKNKKVTEKVNKLLVRELEKSLKLDDFGIKVGGHILYKCEEYPETYNKKFPIWFSINSNDNTMLLISAFGIVSVAYTVRDNQLYTGVQILYNPYTDKIADFVKIVNRYPYNKELSIILRKALQVRCETYMNLKKKWNEN